MSAAVLGVGQTRFGVLLDRDAISLGAEAVIGALRDAGVPANDVGLAFCGSALAGFADGQQNVLGQLVLRHAGLAGMPVARVENACSSASIAFQEAVAAVESGRCDVALAFGVEKMTGRGTTAAMDALAGAGDVRFETEAGLTFPSVFALLAARHVADYGTTRQAIAAVAVKAHANASRNPKAHFRREVSLAEVLAAKPVADPLGVLDCCPVSDGAAAVVVASADYVARHVDRPAAWIRATVLASGRMDSSAPITAFDATVRASAEAYEAAGISPADIDLAEVHDCFTIAEIVHVEDLGFVPKGDGGPATECGFTALGGRIPVNVSGGLKAKGHPVGATGIGQIVELVDQVNGRAGARQVDGARIGLAHCMGGFYGADCASLAVTILERG